MNNNKFIFYYPGHDFVLIYDKDSGATLSMSDIEYKSFINQGNLEQVLLESFSKVEYKSVPWKYKKTFNIDKINCSGIGGLLFESFVVYFSIPLLLLAFLISDAQQNILTISLSAFPIVFLGIMLSFPFGLLLHEFSHAVIAIRNGAYIPELGIGIKQNKMLFAYTRIVGIKYISSEFKRIKIYYAGIGMNYLLSTLVIFLWHFFASNSLFILSLGMGFLLQGLSNSSIYKNSDGFSIFKVLINRFDLSAPSKLTIIQKKENWDMLLLGLQIVHLFSLIIGPAIIFIRWYLCFSK